MGETRREVLGYLAVGGVIVGANTTVGFVADATDDEEGEYTVEELSGDMGDMNLSEVVVEGHPELLEAPWKGPQLELNDSDWSLGDWDPFDDDGVYNGEFVDDVHLSDGEEVYAFHGEPDGTGATIQVYDDNNAVTSLFDERPQEPTEERVRVYGTIKRSDRGYNVEVDAAELV